MVNLNDTSPVPQPTATGQGALLPPALRSPQQCSELLQEVAPTRMRQKESCIENGSDSTTSPSVLLGRTIPRTAAQHEQIPLENTSKKRNKQVSMSTESPSESLGLQQPAVGFVWWK